MPSEIRSREVQKMAILAKELNAKYVRGGPDPWEKSPFAWIKKHPSRRVGSIGEQLVAGWCEAKGLTVERSGDSQADRVIAGHRVEIKFSTLWQSGIYRFQQIRDQKYEYAICLGISPFDAHCWVISKDILRMNVINQTPQHGGESGKDTFWFPVKPLDPPHWLTSCGGSLTSAYEILKKWQVKR